MKIEVRTEFMFELVGWIDVDANIFKKNNTVKWPSDENVFGIIELPIRSAWRVVDGERVNYRCFAVQERESEMRILRRMPWFTPV